MTVLEAHASTPTAAKPSFLEALRCPRCAQALKSTKQLEGGKYGLLACGCSTYPIVDGIAVLRSASSGERVDFARATRCIERNNSAGALAWCLAGSVGSPQRPVMGALERITAGPLRKMVHRLRGTLNRRALSREGLTFRDALRCAKSNLFHEYLYHRFANPSLHAAIPAIALLKELDRPATVLDIACGMGHSSFLIKSLFPDLSVVMADHDFTNLYLARRFFAPDAPAVCLDAESTLPFANDAFDAAFCMDAFHYIEAKSALAKEIDRVVDAHGMLLLPHLHNALGTNPVPGSPVTPLRYLSFWGTRNVRAFSEAALLSSFVSKGSINLTSVTELEVLDDANALTIVAGNAERLWRAHDVSELYENARPLGLNPLYRVARGSTIALQMEWNDANLREECAAALEYMPGVREVDSTAWDELDTPTRQLLQREFVLVPLPANYGPVNTPP